MLLIPFVISINPVNRGFILSETGSKVIILDIIPNIIKYPPNLTIVSKALQMLLSRIEKDRFLFLSILSVGVLCTLSFFT